MDHTIVIMGLLLLSLSKTLTSALMGQSNSSLLHGFVSLIHGLFVCLFICLVFFSPRCEMFPGFSSEHFNTRSARIPELLELPQAVIFFTVRLQTHRLSLMINTQFRDQCIHCIWISFKNKTEKTEICFTTLVRYNLSFYRPFHKM